MNALKNTAVASEEAKEKAAALAEKSITTYEIGNKLFSEYLLPFEVTSLILLAALIGVIVLVKRENQAEN